MKIAWSSNAPFARTGYGVQTRIFTPRIRDLGHDVVILPFYGAPCAPTAWEGMRVYANADVNYGQAMLPVQAAHSQADIVISHMDAWICEPEVYPPGLRWIPYFPVDMEPLPNRIRDKIALAYERVVFSRFAASMLEDVGLSYLYVPHAIEAKVLYRVDQAAARAALKLPQDAFIVGMVAANKGIPARKAFQQQLEAFALFKRRHTDAVLYMHTQKDARMGGYMFPELLDAIGLQEGRDVVFVNQYWLEYGLDDEYMREMYSAFDVLLSVSMGEGFGVPILESQACGTPVIVGNWTAMGELCFAGWKVEKEDADRFFWPTFSWNWVGRPAAIAACLEQAYDAKDNRKLRAKARKLALAYDADLVTRKYWKPALESIAARIRDESPALEQAAG